MDEYLNELKNKKEKHKFNYKLLLTKFLIAVIFFLVSVIFINQSNKNMLLYKREVFDKSLPFSKIKKGYEKIFGSPLPIKKETMTVFKGNLVYKDAKKYFDGTSFIVDNNSLVNNLASGVVVFIGNKDNYGNTVIVQGVDGYDIWYGNITNVGVKLYDYIEKDSVLGSTIDDKLYLVIKKDDKFIDYDQYQN